jgi:putative transposase
MGRVVQHRTPHEYLDDFIPEAAEKLHYDHRRTPPKAG